MRFLVGLVDFESILSFEHLILCHWVPSALVDRILLPCAEDVISVVVAKLLLLRTLFDVLY